MTTIMIIILLQNFQVQRFGLRMCTRRWNADYNELLLLFNIPSLHDHRCYLSLCTMYKIIYENVEFPPNFFTPKPPSHLRSSTSALLFIQSFAKTNFRKYSFLPHISSIWNNLPTHVTKAQSLMASPELIIHSSLPIIQILYSHIYSLLFRKHSPIIHLLLSFCILF